MNKSPVILLALILTALGCAPSEGSLRPAQFAHNFPDLAALPLADRIAPIPTVLLDDLKAGDRRDNYRPHTLTEDERKLVVGCLASLPISLRGALESRVRGIGFLDEFAGGGLTWDLYDDRGLPAGFWMVFNSRVLADTTSQWLTYRDSTGFGPGTEAVVTETAMPDVPAFRFLITHEAAHVFDFDQGVTPTAREILARKALMVSEGDFSYGRLYPLNSAWHFYDLVPGAKPAASTLPAAVDALVASAYASFYGSQTAMEDWAELVTYGVLLRDAGVEVTLRLDSGAGPLREWTPTTDPKVRARIIDALARLESRQP